MEEYLKQPNAAFYRIISTQDWNEIQDKGNLESESGRIFVVNAGELPILLCIAFEQLPRLDEFIIIKFPQAKNNFTLEEITPDPQAKVELTTPFQNIILRKSIPLMNIELMMKLSFTNNENIREFLSRIGFSFNANYQSHMILEWARNLKYPHYTAPDKDLEEVKKMFDE